ncbi:hypothetical protein G9A89_009513 [Geosiphon pyriformis]|nr:hypothetical protein G9A89_009513 [Geosiphon pyriformis]
MNSLSYTSIPAISVSTESPISVAGTEFSTLESFLQWAKGHGIVSTSTAVKQVPDKGLGIVSTTPLFRDNSSIVSVPSTVLINASKVGKYAKENAPKLESFYQALLRDGISLTERNVLVSFILYELIGRPSIGDSTSQASIWKPYLEILPKELHTPVFYNKTLKSCLDGTSINSAVDSKLNKLRRDYETLKPYFNKWTTSPPTLQPGAASVNDVVTFEDFKWADGVFWSRVISFGSRFNILAIEKSLSEADLDDYHMVPYIDIANHSLTPLARWEVTPEGLELILTKTTNPEPIPAETEIRISYGEKPNSELLFLHGFALRDNPWSAISIPVPFFDEDPIVDEKLMFMKFHGINSLVSLSRKNDGVDLPHEANRAMWLCVLNEDDGLKITPSLINKSQPVELAIEDKVIHNIETLDKTIQALDYFPVIELRVMTMILSTVEDLLSNLSHTNEQVLKVMETVNSREMEYLRIYREDEHRFLRFAIQEFTRKRDVLMDNDIVKRYLQME